MFRRNLRRRNLRHQVSRFRHLLVVLRNRHHVDEDVLRRMKRQSAIVLIVASLLLAACAPEKSMDQRAEQFTELMARPDIEQAAARYEQLYRQVRDAVTSVVPAMKWRQTDQLTGAACGRDYPGLDGDGEIRGLPNWLAEGNIADVRWEGAVSAVRGVARGYGFMGEEVTVDRPGDHEVVFHDQYRPELNFGTAVNTTLLLRTGCHLTAAAKARGVPAPEPSY